MASLYICIFIVQLLMVISGSPRSIAHTLFTDQADDPFMDSYIETMLRTTTKAIIAMPKMNDADFLQYLLRDDSSNLVSRVDASIFDPILDAQLERQTDIDKEWENLMVAGPLVINYMGNLMIIASKRDFSFQAPAQYIYRRIRYPNSFRATLAQVSSDMYTALMDAHTGMDSIQLAIQQVPSYVKTALKLISSATDNMLKLMLPRTLESIGRVATESAQIANSTLSRFNLLEDLLAEIIELSTNTQSSYEENVDKMKEQIQNSTLEQQRLKQNLEFIQSQYNQSKADLKIARERYAKAQAELSASLKSKTVIDEHLSRGILNTAVGLVFAPIKALGCLLGACDKPTYIIDNTKFENAMASALLAKEDLERAEQLHNEHFLLQLNEQNALAKAINQMASLNLSILSTDEIIRVLLEAISHIHSIREQWGRMVQFFSKLAAQAHSTQQVIVKDFIEVIQQAQNDNLLVDPFEHEFFLEILMPATTTIERGAHLLYTMAKTYYSVSGEYMIDQIAGIGKMLILQTDEERQGHLQQASNNTLTVSLRVTQLVQERSTRYQQELHNRQAEYTAYINNLAAAQLQGVIG